LFNYPLVFEDLGEMIRARLGKEYVLNFVKPFGKGGDRNTLIFEKNSLTLSTVHGAKGYDAYVVFLAGADLFREDEAGRASFYVGATRAKLTLHVTGLKSAILTEAQQVIARARSLRV
jgi:superfamily I DNA/RNA helicase